MKNKIKKGDFMLKNLIVKNILIGAAIAILCFLIMSIFLLNDAYKDPNANLALLDILRQIAILAFVGIVSWVLFRLRNTSFLKKPISRIILSALAVAGFGFILLGLTFFFGFLFQSLITKIVKLFIPVNVNPEMDYYWFPSMLHALFVVVVGLISWPIFRSKLRVPYKAIYMTVPLAVVFVTLGIFLYRWPVVAFSIGGLFSIGVLYSFYRTKQPWIYYYTVILVATALAIMTFLGVQI
ncbi:MAG: hypothetical protein ABIG86_01015 [Patescibacteria group bacterium]